MTKFNWHNAKKELPTHAVDDNGLPKRCLVVSYRDNKPYFYKDWIDSFTKRWAHSDDGEPDYWIYLSEIPLPED